MSEPTLGRAAILARFIRNQASLTDKHPHKPGPGSVTLNNEEALLCADALESLRSPRDTGMTEEERIACIIGASYLGTAKYENDAERKDYELHAAILRRLAGLES